MNDAARASCKLIETSLSKSPAYKKINTGFYVVKQGSSIVMVSVVPFKDKEKDGTPKAKAGRAVVRCWAQLVKGVQMEAGLAFKLLEMNALLRFGHFAFVPKGSVVLFSHTILGGTTLDEEELLATIRDVAIIADEYDDRIAAQFGGQTMQDLLEENVMEHLLEGHGRDDLMS